MSNRVKKIHKITNYQYLNFYSLDIIHPDGSSGTYQVASRAKTEKDLKLVTGENNPDGVIIYSLYGEKQEQVVLIRQYRSTLDNYIYEFPAGLVEKNESFEEAAIREMKEETGLLLTPIPVDACFSKPYFTTIGMTDESCATVYGFAAGTPSREFQEKSEDIDIILADKKEVKRILKEEKVSIMCAYMLMHFLQSEEGQVFDFLKL